MSKKSKLVIDPGKEIHFEGSVQPPGPKPASLDLRNPNSDKRIAFKLRTLDPSRYVVTPRIGILEPGSEVTVNIRFKAVQNMNSYQPDRQRFLVQAMIVQDDKLTPEQCFQTAQPRTIGTSKLKCLFFEKCPTGDRHTEAINDEDHDETASNKSFTSIKSHGLKPGDICDCCGKMENMGLIMAIGAVIIFIWIRGKIRL
ncbi:hypothetical protein RDWZM_006479 [Blomia tropicalis]|uniref:MSP domain-containing protein n=1 Tax=Blomia tropicalis TaxID=40697 RepID=A0A9Q0MAK9_BLOTA|nr:hypothetical protein BLOT_008573 [Blomia tropicalis]KAJ6220667.1 hypothetical protein RDWZM_006479 [Blomia tropicalis]